MKNMHWLPKTMSFKNNHRRRRVMKLYHCSPQQAFTHFAERIFNQEQSVCQLQKRHKYNFAKMKDMLNTSHEHL